MLTLRPSDQRGHLDHGWLDTYHTFSFGGYHDPRHTHFGPLRVINQDRIAPGTGFGLHPHENMEIVTVVLDGVVEHTDSLGNRTRIGADEVQVMSAGSGIVHGEANPSESEELHLLQLWVFPRERDTEPRYGQRSFGPWSERDGLALFASPDGREESLAIDQDLLLHGGVLAEEQSLEHPLPAGSSAWLHVADGALELNGTRLGPGDGASLTDEATLSLRGLEPARFLLFTILPEAA